MMQSAMNLLGHSQTDTSQSRPYPRRWTTRSRIGFSSTPEELQQAYRVVKGRLAD